MLGLMIIIGCSVGLFAWVYLTRLAMRIGGRIAASLNPENHQAQKYGKWAGFMLLMGGWFIWWAIEFVINWKVARDMCLENGTYIYISPDEWKEMVGGEEDWRKIKPKFDSHPLPNEEIPSTLKFNEKIYYLYYQISDQLFFYKSEEKKYHSLIFRDILFDTKLKKVILKKGNYYSTQKSMSAKDLDPEGLKFWIGIATRCKESEYFNVEYNYLFLD